MELLRLGIRYDFHLQRLPTPRTLGGPPVVSSTWPDRDSPTTTMSRPWHDHDIAASLVRPGVPNPSLLVAQTYQHISHISDRNPRP